MYTRQQLDGTISYLSRATLTMKHVGNSVKRFASILLPLNVHYYRKNLNFFNALSDIKILTFSECCLFSFLPAMLFTHFLECYEMLLPTRQF